MYFLEKPLKYISITTFYSRNQSYTQTINMGCVTFTLMCIGRAVLLLLICFQPYFTDEMNNVIQKIYKDEMDVIHPEIWDTLDGQDRRVSN